MINIDFLSGVILVIVLYTIFIIHENMRKKRFVTKIGSDLDDLFIHGVKLVTLHIDKDFLEDIVMKDDILVIQSPYVQQKMKELGFKNVICDDYIMAKSNKRFNKRKKEFVFFYSDNVHMMKHYIRRGWKVIRLID
ncbi:MAG: hypothetical protein RSC93_01120 [Erysipelotrichaceae bacterium]